jgi:hypothetical protein
MALKRVRASVFLSVFISAAAALVVAADVSAAESPGISNSTHSETTVTIGSGVVVETHIVTESGGETQETVTVDGSVTVSSDSNVEGVQTNVTQTTGPNVSDSAEAAGNGGGGATAGGSTNEAAGEGAVSTARQGVGQERASNSLTQEALANIKKTTEPVWARGGAAAGVVRTINRDTNLVAAAIGSANDAPEAPVPASLPTGGLERYTAALPSGTLVPLWQQLSGSAWGGAEVLEGLGLAYNSGILLVLLLVLALTAYVWRLKKSGFSFAARSDAGNLVWNGFVTPRVSFARAGTQVRSSLFSGGKSEMLMMGAIGH